jgi:spore coat polysaccharide biosynthesis predicted glycosyltransferase SpsG
VIAIRVEDRKQFGQGHRSRAIALAQACKRANQPYILFISDGDWYSDLVRQGIAVSMLYESSGDADEIRSMLSELKKQRISFLIIDGYRFGPEFISKLNEEGVLCAVIDDTAEIPKTSAWRVINPNIYATDEIYSRDWQIKSYTGANYILLREPFINQREAPLEKGVISLSLGVSAGKELINLLTRELNLQGFNVVNAVNLDSSGMVSLIDRSELIICGASVTLHEVWARNRFALPVYQVRDQLRFSRYLRKLGVPYVESINRSAIDVCRDIMNIFNKTRTLNIKIDTPINRNGADWVLSSLLNDLKQL